MKVNIKPFGILLLGIALGACEKVKTEEARADLPKSSVEDTLVFSPDNADIDTSGVAYTGDDSTYDAYASEWPAEDLAYTPKADRIDNGTNTLESTPSRNDNASAGLTENSEDKSTSSSTVKTENRASTPAKRAVYRKPSKASLQRSLASDARRSSQMSLNELRRYWTTRQYYYKRASKEVKYVGGKVKISINQEETKIETALGKVKMEPGDVKVKPD